MLILWLFLVVVFGSAGFFTIAFSDIENAVLVSIICFSVAAISTMLFAISMIRIRFKYNAEVERLANLPKFNVIAKVISKIVDKSEFSVAIAGDPSLGTDNTPIKEYYVCFEFNSRRENFHVDVLIYNKIRKNDIGDLRYKEDDGEFIFVDFQPHL